MPVCKQVTTAAAIGVVALSLAGCSSDVTPTGWIPHDGVISGVISLSGQATLAGAPA